MKLLDGKAFSAELISKIQVEVEQLKNQYKRSPRLVLILVGDNENSKKFVAYKELCCQSVGIENEMIPFPENVTQKTLIQKIEELNLDKNTDGILVQLPLPEHIDKQKVIESIAPYKDVDGLHPINIGNLGLGKDSLEACTAQGIITLLKHNHIPISGKRAVIIGRSNLVGKPTAQMLLRENATVTICHTHTSNLTDFTRTADILILAMGNPNVVTPEMLKDDAIVIDIAMNRKGKCLFGDIYNKENLPKLEEKVSAITPVPGGIGPLTITFLVKNTLKSFIKREEDKLG